MKFPSTRPSSVLGASLLSLGVLLVVRSAHPSAQVAPRRRRARRGWLTASTS